MEIANTELERAGEQQAAASKALCDQEVLNSGLREELASANSAAAELEAAKERAHAAAEEAVDKSKEMENTLAGVRDSCFEYQARAVTAEGSLEELAADVARLQELGKEALSREEALLAVVEASKNTALAKDKQLEANEQALEAVRGDLAGKAEELSALHEEFEEVRLEMSEGERKLEVAEKMLKEEVERVQAAEEDIAVAKGTVQGLENEVESLEEKVVDAKNDLAAAIKEIAAARDEVKEVEERLRYVVLCMNICFFMSSMFTSIGVYFIYVSCFERFV